jgi:hypothetical protein
VVNLQRRSANASMLVSGSIMKWPRRAIFADVRPLMGGTASVPSHFDELSRVAPVEPSWVQTRLAGRLALPFRAP